VAAVHKGVSRALDGLRAADARDVVQVTLNYSKQDKRIVIKMRVMRQQPKGGFVPTPWTTAFAIEEGEGGGHFQQLPPRLTPCFSC